MKTFFKWLCDQDYRDDIVGDLAKDVRQDTNLPIKKTKNTLLAHVAWESDYSENVIRAFNQAWEEYKQYRKIVQ